MESRITPLALLKDQPHLVRILPKLLLSQLVIIKSIYASLRVVV